MKKTALNGCTFYKVNLIGRKLKLLKKSKTVSARKIADIYRYRCIQLNKIL